MDYLKNKPDVQLVGVLVPCQFTPRQSHLHNPVLDDALCFFICEPPLGFSTDERKTHRDEREHSLLAHHRIIWSFLRCRSGSVKEYTDGSGYREWARFFNTHFHDANATLTGGRNSVMTNPAYPTQPHILNPEGRMKSKTTKTMKPGQRRGCMRYETYEVWYTAHATSISTVSSLVDRCAPTINYACQKSRATQNSWT
ncbi:hypothetical protein G7K_1835-t1 [Saitoella complicata NRRL Y-17804]|uniref:Uncharacterized protein n=1 Tax=Saitoella complicata (strain BCRC 22490 / CBS 7301 / JCM 7358 / NBRC 10748 / NRRL Y-17804) TaxID=698492 RepID=A0A0E9NDZ6_SAICN|nr:hypothetical protein G7K_1835-t1 [Saitoella complicata NRRL Y-17804]